MAPKFQKLPGTLDVLPAESWKWQYAEEQMRTVAGLFGYREIRLPTFESTELYQRGVGEGTDVVSKEMYTFEDKGGRSCTLRPEGTAGVVRAVLENGLLAASPLPLKSYYIESHFRYERAQKGRYREHHQFGIECFGTHAPEADAEVIAVADMLLRRIGLGEYASLEVNSIGCPACRPAYNQALRAYFGAREGELCDTCKGRLQTNPLRLLDCKEEACQAIAKDAPSMLEYLCEDCAGHFAAVQALLAEAGIAFVVNPRIVRGLDYYTNTVFEFVASGIGAQGTVCGGGRYDGLIGELGGAPTPAVGFGMGVERLLMLVEEAGKLPPAPDGPLLYAVAADEAGRAAARKLVAGLRAKGYAAEYDIVQRSVKAQMKAAARLGAHFTVVLGEAEVQGGSAKFKNMQEEGEVPFLLDSAAEALEMALFRKTARQFGGRLKREVAPGTLDPLQQCFLE